MDLRHLDETLLFLDKAASWMRRDQIDKHLREVVPDDDDYDVDIITAKLLKDGMILHEHVSTAQSRAFGDTGHAIYTISYDGYVLLHSGGYAQKQLKEEKEREFLEKKMDLEIRQIQSVVDTNESVIATNSFVRENIHRQNRLTVTSIIVAGASALFALAAVISQFIDETSKEVQLLRLQLQKQSQIQQQMQQSQKGIDSSLKIFLDRPYFKDTNNAGQQPAEKK